MRPERRRSSRAGRRALRADLAHRTADVEWGCHIPASDGGPVLPLHSGETQHRIGEPSCGCLPELHKLGLLQGEVFLCLLLSPLYFWKFFKALETGNVGKGGRHHVTLPLGTSSCRRCAVLLSSVLFAFSPVGGSVVTVCGLATQSPSPSRPPPRAREPTCPCPSPPQGRARPLVQPLASDRRLVAPAPRPGRAGDSLLSRTSVLGRVALVALEATPLRPDAGCSLFWRLSRPERLCWNRHKTWPGAHVRSLWV